MTECSNRRVPRFFPARAWWLVVVAVLSAWLHAAETKDQRVAFPFVEVDRSARQVRVECEALNVEMPLEFFCVKFGGPEHEALLRTRAQPSHIHAGLLLLGLEPGAPTRYSEAADKWLAPHGPPLRVSIAFERDGKHHVIPAHQLMRHVKTGKEMPPFNFIFAGSRVMEDGVYAADVAGYVASIVNFELSLIDVPELASNANETLQWEFNPATVPPQGTKLTMVIEPVDNRDGAPTTAPSSTMPAPPDLPAPTTQPGAGTSGASKSHADTSGASKSHADTPVACGSGTANPVADGSVAAGSGASFGEIDLRQLRERWKSAVAPHADALRRASQTHYDVIRSLRAEQQRLIDEADRIQRLIDELEREYARMTTPQPAPR